MTVQFEVNIKYGYVAIDSWVEINRLSDGSYELIGMGCKKEFDQNGRPVSFDVSPTGMTGTAPHNAFGEPRSFKQWLSGFKSKFFNVVRFA